MYSIMIDIVWQDQKHFEKHGRENLHKAKD